MRLTWKGFWWLFRRSLVQAYEDNCFSIARGAAYSAILSFFPLLTVTAAILVQLRAQPISRILSQALSEAVPPGTEELVLEHFRVHGERPRELLVAATLVSIWAATRVMTSLMEGFHAAYHIPLDRPFLRRQGVALLLVFAAAVPVLGASMLVLFGARSEQVLLGWLGVAPAGVDLEAPVRLIGGVLRYGVALGATVLVGAILFYFGPNRPQQWRRMWPGAILAAVLWLAATQGFAWYFRNIADYNVLYGSIGAVIALLLWMYMLAAIALVGCEFNAEYERMELIESR